MEVLVSRCRSLPPPPGSFDFWLVRIRPAEAILLAIMLAGLNGVSQGACVPVPISQEPQSMVVLAGCRATFQVQASGSGPIFYQWFEEENPIPGATNHTYTTPPVTVANSGKRYQV